MKSKKTLGLAAVVLTTIIWGGGFLGIQIALRAGMSSGVMVTIRFGLAAILAGIVFRKKLRGMTGRDLKNGAIAGVVMILAFYSQTLGGAYTTAANNGFITQLDAVVVPFVAWMLTGRRPRWNTIPAALLCVAGVFALTYWNAGASFSRGDLLTLVCAVLFGVHMAFLGKAAAETPFEKLLFLQLATAFVCTLPLFFFRELPTLAATDWKAAILPVLYLGVLATFVCFLLQTWAMKHVGSGTVAILTAAEGVWCALFSVLIGFDRFSWGLVVGGLTIVAAATLAEWRPGMFARKKEKEPQGETVDESGKALYNKDV